MDKVKTGLIGCGKVGHFHATALKNLTESQFVAVCDCVGSRAEAFAQQYGVSAFSDIEEMIQTTRLDAVVVATPHPKHVDPAVAAINAGSHVVVEKPLASTLEDCDTMIDIAKKKNKILAVISQRRLYPPVRRIKEAIVEGKLGKPVLGTVNMFGWRDESYYNSDPWRGRWHGEGGGVLVNQAPHQLDILQWYMGSVRELYGCWANLNHPTIEVEDTSVAIIRFRSGAIGNILVSNSQNPPLYGKIAVYGKNGASVGVQTDGGAMFIAGISSIATPPINDLWTIPGEEEKAATWKKEDSEFFMRIDATKYFHQLQIRDFLEAIIKGRAPMISGEEGRKTVELFTAIYRSQRDNVPVQFPLLPENDRDDMDGRLKIERH
jgi:UDP-N-acetyl-2-amino-2-deoxyglucuronate dehydrogenase